MRLPAVRSGLLLAVAMVMSGPDAAAADESVAATTTTVLAAPSPSPVTPATPEPPTPLASATPATPTPAPPTPAPPTPAPPTPAPPTPAPPTPAPPTTPEPPAASTPATPLVRPAVLLYGDSLAWEARHVFEQALADHSSKQPGDPPVDVTTRTFGGTAICDWHDEMAEDAARLRPGLVVIEFVGNNYTPCMQDPAGEPLVGTALTDRYAADAAIAIDIFAAVDAQIVFAGAPISRPATASLDLHHAPLNAVYEQLGQQDGVRYVDAGAAVLDGGRWTDSLPCLPLEPCADDGRNVVRAPDGLHFCPASAEAERGVTGDCPVWSSGAFRFGAALARPVLDSLGVTTGPSAAEA